jgi:hypothetical protein
MFKTFLEVSIIILAFLIVGIVVYMTYTRRINKILKGKQRKRIKSSLEFRLLIVALMGILTMFSYVIINYTIEQSKFHSFKVEVSDNIGNLDFEDFYNDLYITSRADGDILIGRDKTLHMKFDQNGNIKELTLIVLIPRDGMLIEYVGIYKDGFIYFKTIPSIVNPSVFFYRLNEYTTRLEHFDFSIIYNQSTNSGDDYWIDVNFGYIINDETVTHSNLADSIEVNIDNSIQEINEISFEPLSYTINIWVGTVFVDQENQIGSQHIQTIYLVD